MKQEGFPKEGTEPWIERGLWKGGTADGEAAPWLVQRISWLTGDACYRERIMAALVPDTH